MKQGFEKPLVIAGSGRSGTTWVQDVIASANGLKTIFEPLLPVLDDTAKKYADRYLTAEVEAPQLNAYMDRIFSGSLDNVWTNYRVRPDRLKPSLEQFKSCSKARAFYRRYKNLLNNYRIYNKGPNDGVSVKFIRANLMLEWLEANYDINVLFILRHPCAVIESKLRLDQVARDAGLIEDMGDWDPYARLERYFKDGLFMQDYITPYIGELDVFDLSPAEANTVIWCLENRPILTKGPGYGRSLACYETLVSSGSEEWERIADELSINGLVDKSLLTKPSQQASQDFHSAASISSKLSRWQDRFVESDKKRIDDVLTLFNIDVYSAFDPMPKNIFNLVKRAGNSH